MFRSKSYKICIAALVIGTLTWTTLSLPPHFVEAAAARNEASVPDTPDPCEQLLTPPGNANGLHKRCDAIGIGGGAAKGDFNGDSFADLAVGVPFEDQNGVNAVGGVNIIYGSSAGLTSTADQFLDEADFGFSYASNDHFGWALAAGDFNGDGFSDLAIGVPEHDSGSPDTGLVFVINGSQTGLDNFSGQFLDLPGHRGRTGAALVWADFNGDGFGDLAIGSPEATVTGETFLCTASFTTPSAGEVVVLYGSASGLMPRFGAQVLHQGHCTLEPDGSMGIGDAMESGDRFGSSLTASRHTTGGADLIIGVPFEDLGLFDKQDAGLVHLIEGSSSGLGFVGNLQVLSQDTSGVGGAAETGDQFGRVLAMGDFNGDGDDDLAVGVPFEDLSSNSDADAGAVQVFFAGSGGDVVTTSGSLFISQASLPGENIEAGDLFGWSLAVGDFDADGRDDLAIGSPGEDVSSNSIRDAGLVSVLYGSSSGPSLTRVQEFTQDSTGIPDVAEPGDEFGYALSAWNFGNGRESDLAIGVPFEDLTSTVTDTLQQDAGAVTIIYGNLTGLNATARPAQLWTQDSPGINDSSQVGDHFGQVLY